MSQFHRKSNKFTDDYGNVITNLHPEADDCLLFGCVIHNPGYKGPLRLRWRTAGFFDIKPSHFERVCEHGVGHPDPDAEAWRRRAGLDSLSVHGCDGCCG